MSFSKHCSPMQETIRRAVDEYHQELKISKG
jgi:hypothetical protein